MNKTDMLKDASMLFEQGIKDVLVTYADKEWSACPIVSDKAIEIFEKYRKPLFKHNRVQFLSRSLSLIEKNCDMMLKLWKGNVK